jgi:uncharacterized membrane protein YgcG
VLAVLAIEDRRSRIEVGYGLEGQLPDAKARAILDGARPHLRSERYVDAVAHIIDELIAATGGPRVRPSVAPTELPSSTAENVRRPLDPSAVPTPVRHVRFGAVVLYVAALALTSVNPHLRSWVSPSGTTGDADSSPNETRRARRRRQRAEAKKAREAAGGSGARGWADVAWWVLLVVPFGVVPTLLPDAYWLGAWCYPACGVLVALVALVIGSRAAHDGAFFARWPVLLSGSVAVLMVAYGAGKPAVPYPDELRYFGFESLLFAALASAVFGIRGAMRQGSSGPWFIGSSSRSSSSSSSSSSVSSSSSSSSSSDSSSGGGSYGGGGGGFGGGGASSDW